MKMKEKLIAIALRKQGKSYKDILKKIRVSKATLSLWLKDVPLTNKQQYELYTTRRQHNAYQLAKKKQQIKKELINSIHAQTYKEGQQFYKNPLFLAGIMLYWAEGDKSEEFEHVKFTNSDPKMIKLIMLWFRNICLTPEDKFRITLHIHTLHCRKQMTTYWSRITGIPSKQFNKTQIKPTTLKFRKKPLYNGTCAISVHNKNLFRKIMGWKTGALETMYQVGYTKQTLSPYSLMDKTRPF